MGKRRNPVLPDSDSDDDPELLAKQLKRDAKPPAGAGKKQKRGGGGAAAAGAAPRKFEDGATVLALWRDKAGMQLWKARVIRAKLAKGKWRFVTRCEHM